MVVKRITRPAKQVEPVVPPKTDSLPTGNYLRVFAKPDGRRKARSIRGWTTPKA